MKKRTSGDPLKQVVRDIAQVARYLWEREWAEGNAGNLSVDITELAPHLRGIRSRFRRIDGGMAPEGSGGRTFYVTAAGSRLRDLARAPEKGLVLIRVAEDRMGYHLIGGRGEAEKKPSSELISHLAIHGFLREKKLPQKAVVHTHPTALIALTQLRMYRSEKAVNRLLPRMLPEMNIVLPEGVGLAPYRPPGTAALAEATIHALRRHRIVLWEKHGCTAIGRDVFEAFDLIDTANKAAEIFFLCRMAGYDPEGSSAKQLIGLEKPQSKRRISRI